jgi:ribosomal protein S27E
MTRPPFREVEPESEYVASSAARISCGHCSEWIYTVRKRTGGPSFFPAHCPVCGADIAEERE